MKLSIILDKGLGLLNCLSCGDCMEVKGPRVVQDGDVRLRVWGWGVRTKVLVLEVEIELGASVSEYCPEEDDEKQGKRDSPEYVALAAVPALEVSADYGVDSASQAQFPSSETLRPVRLRNTSSSVGRLTSISLSRKGV
jgi:hypothetical protein